MTNVALIPARAGSSRLPRKNFKLLNGKPLFQWTVGAALDSHCYDHIILATDDASVHPWPQITTARHGSTELSVFVRAPASSIQIDLEWILEVQAAGLLDGAETFSILRPTSPFRSAETIRRAWAQWAAVHNQVDSLRAVRRSSEHPQKQWIVESPRLMRPLESECDVPYGHNLPSQALHPMFVQCGALEISWTRNLLTSWTAPDGSHGFAHQNPSISGDRVAPFIVEGPESLDVNTLQDFWLAERYLAEGLV